MKYYNISIRGKLFKFFEGRLQIKKSTQGWWRCDCIMCGGHHTFGLNLEQRRVKCFKCDYNSDPIRLLMYIQNFETLPEAWKFLNVQQEYDSYERNLNKGIKKVETIKMDLPDSFKLIIQGDSIMGNSARHYMKKRGFNLTKISLQGVGYCTDGEYAGYIIFPFYRKGSLVYFQGRRYMGNGPKMKNPSEELYGVGKSSLIYNEDALYIYNKIYALESITNSLTLGDNTIGLSGKKASAIQLTKMIMSPCHKIILVLDSDAMKDAYELALQLVQYKEIKVIKMPDNKDVNDIGKKATLEIVKKIPYARYIDLLREKNNLNEGPIITYKRIPSNYSATRGA